MKAIVQLSNNMINHAKFLMMMHVCEEQLSLFLVLLLISSQKLHNLFNKLFPKKFMASDWKMFYLNFQMHIAEFRELSNLFPYRLNNNVS